jgi:hypothetical protein
MVSKGEVSNDFRKQVLGYGLTTAEIVYRRPDRHWLLQTYVWQDYDPATDFAWKMMAAADVPNASKTDAQVVAQGILRSLISHNGKGVQNVADGKPAKCG